MPIMIRLATLAVASLFLLAPTAFGHTKTALDPDDTSGPLDIAAVRTTHRVVGEQSTGDPEHFRRRTILFFRLLTYETWNDEALSGEKNFVSFEFDRDDNGAANRCVVIRDDAQPDLTGRLFKDCTYTSDDRLVAEFVVTRPDEHSVRFSIAKRQLGRRLWGYRWRAVTSYEEQNPNSPCPAPNPHGDGGYGTCADFTKWTRHSF